MKPLILILSLFVALTAFGQHADSSKSLAGKWHLIFFRDLKTGQMTDTASLQNGWLANYKDVVIGFEGNADSGTIDGRTFCNGIRTKYHIYGNKIIFDVYMSTQVYCQYEDKLTKALGNISSYKKSSDTLIIFYNNDSEEMVFNAVK